jgi:hypothetical protein
MVAEKNATIQALVEGVLTEIMVKTTGTQVYIDENTTVSAKLAEIITALNGKATTQDVTDAEARAKDTAQGLVNTAIAELIDSAPETYDTLKEIADYISSDTTAMEALNQAIAGKADANHTHAAFTGATSSNAGTAGFVPAPGTSDTGKYLKGDGSWATVPTTTVDTSLSSSSTNPVQNKVINTALAGKSDTSHTHSAFTGATSSSAGAAGFVPAPGTSDTAKYLKGDGSWSTVPSATVDSSLSTTSTNAVQNKVVAAAIAAKGTVYVSSTQPSNLASGDLWIQID